MGYFLYLHKNKVTNGKYVGITKDPKKRFSGEGTQYKPKGKCVSRFYNAILKYGWESFETEILESGLTFEEACQKEIDKIKELKEKGEVLYNIADGGNGGLIYAEHPKGMKGKPQTEHQKKSHREWASNKENNCMTNGSVIWGETHEHPKGMKGKKHTSEHKKRISEMMKNNHPHADVHKVIYPNGNEKSYKSLSQLCEDLKISTPFARKIRRSGEPFVLSEKVTSNREVLEKLEGIRIIKDNTEVTKGTKEPLVP